MDIYSFASQLLADVVEALEDADRTVPDRQYVTTGEVADDCEQLVVAFRRLIPTTGDLLDDGPMIVECAIMPVAEFEVRLTKCVPTSDDAGNPPQPTTLNNDASEKADDAQALLAAVHTLAEQGAWGLEPLETVGPTGGYLASSITLRVSTI